ncbi:DUF896 domain-containing protein [Haliovirga abyssi]|uniref:Uncharacterized protein n=1 Tax=Haliovirga abyssi TaxID=2996794 RepID=A0AAU9D521_9FUSO|nr:DUF896 domain-containing protein [Haliovirga abyssi]BDU49653.1 hypothetical protein HLVA_02220 [Haliovirga abyssi]
MEMKDLINEINDLSRKSKSIGLTSQEKKKQKKLREEYLEIFRNNFRNHLDRIKIVDVEETR